MTGRGQGRGRGRGRGGQGQGQGRGRGQWRGRGTGVQKFGTKLYPIQLDKAQDELLNFSNTPIDSFQQPKPSPHPIGKHGFGSSTPRGFPARKQFTQASQNSTLKGGLGFRLNTSSKPVSKLNPSSFKPSQSFNREKTDPRLWIPVKFVKATALSDKSILENSREDKLHDTPAVQNEPSIPQKSTSIEPETIKESASSKIPQITQKNKASTLDYDLQPLPASNTDDPTQTENFTEASIEHWQAQFPGIFNITSSTNAFQTRAPNEQCSHSSISLELSKNLGQPKDISLAASSKNSLNGAALEFCPQSTSAGSASHNRLTHTDSYHVQPKDSQNNSASTSIGPSTKKPNLSNIDFTDSSSAKQKNKSAILITSNDGDQLTNPPEVSHIQLNHQPTEIFNLDCHNLPGIQISKPDIQASRSFDSPNTVPVTKSNSLALFFEDDKGDPHNIPLVSSTRPTVLGQVSSQDSDSEDEEISFQLTNCSPPKLQIDNSHLYRTITDDANLQPQSSSKKPSLSNSKSVKLPSSKASKKFNRTQKRKERRNLARQGQSFTHRPDTDSGSDIDLGDETQQEPIIASTSRQIQSSAISRKAQKRALKQKEEQELLEDYIQHTMMSEQGSEGEDDLPREVIAHDQNLVEKMKNDIFLKTFMRGIDQQESHHITIDQLDQRAQEEEDDDFIEDGGWQSESSASSIQNGLEALDLEVSKSDSESLESGSGEEECILDQMCSELLETLPDEDTDVESDIDINSISKRYGKSSLQNSCRRIKLKAKFEAKWRDKITKGSSDIKLKKLFESVEMALASSSESNDSETQSEDPEENLPTLTKDIFVHKKKGKNKQKKTEFIDDEDNDSELIEFIDELQAQWKKDKSKKAERKKLRAEARLLNNEPKTQKQRKKMEKRNIKDGNNHELDLLSLDKIIRDFISFRPDTTSLNLPPLSKKTRARAHELATLYGMTSRSFGSGSHRYPVLHRTHRTTISMINKQKHRRIIYGTSQSNQMQPLDGKRIYTKDGNSKMGLQHGRNKEGGIVGEGVGHIGEENVGFKLLTKMGWSLGQTMGNPLTSASAIHVPVLAVMKSSKAGLGSSCHLQRS